MGGKPRASHVWPAVATTRYRYCCTYTPLVFWVLGGLRGIHFPLYALYFIPISQQRSSSGPFRAPRRHFSSSHYIYKAELASMAALRPLPEGWEERQDQQVMLFLSFGGAGISLSAVCVLFILCQSLRSSGNVLYTAVFHSNSSVRSVRLHRVHNISTQLSVHAVACFVPTSALSLSLTPSSHLVCSFLPCCRFWRFGLSHRLGNPYCCTLLYIQRTLITSWSAPRLLPHIASVPRCTFLPSLPSTPLSRLLLLLPLYDRATHTTLITCRERLPGPIPVCFLHK